MFVYLRLLAKAAASHLVGTGFALNIQLTLEH